MTDSEKKLDKILSARAPYMEGEDRKFLINDILKSYPQITKKPVKLENLYNILNFSSEEIISQMKNKKQWIDEHYVEVVNE